MGALIIGDSSDSHVSAVLDAMTQLGATMPIVLDAPGLQANGFSFTLDKLTYQSLTVDVQDGLSSGWLRRYAPTVWGAGTVAGSLEAVTKRSFLALVGAITRVGARRWLTPLDAMLRSEDRLAQLEAARRLGIRVPKTIVTSESDAVVRHLGRRFVVKPLTIGYFRTSDGPKAVFTSSMTDEEAKRVDFGSAPFLAQELIEATEHLRVVTVRDSVWTASLDADNRPLDWRQQDEAHFEWIESDDGYVGERALALAKALGVGYSSQDWIRNPQGITFLDFNPGGQWLFLPTAVANAVTNAIAHFLSGSDE
jgi:hypothetical protein